MAPVPCARTVTSACNVGVPIKLPQVTLSTCAPVGGCTIAVQCDGDFTASGQGCAPSAMPGVAVTEGVAFAAGVPLPGFGVGLPPFPLLPPPLHALNASSRKSSRQKPVYIYLRRPNHEHCIRDLLFSGPSAFSYSHYNKL